MNLRQFYLPGDRNTNSTGYHCANSEFRVSPGTLNQKKRNDSKEVMERQTLGLRVWDER